MLRVASLANCLAVAILASHPFFSSAALFAQAKAGSEKPSAHPRVLGFERFFSGEADPVSADPVQGGLLLLGELSCTSCHAAEASLNEQLVKKQPPILDEIGARAKPAYLAKFLANPQAVKPGTPMPNVFASLPAAEAEANALALAHFLATTGKNSDSVPTRQAAIRGDNLYHSVGCVVCHGPRKEDSQPLAGSIPLGVPSRKYTYDGLTKFLQDPLHVRPSGRMPNPNLSGDQAGDVAAFLLGDTATASGLDFAVYAGNFERLPDFSKLKPVESGPAEKIDVNVTKRKDQFALRFEGLIQVPAEGDYTFYIASDDGSRLSIDGRVVVDNDGVHAPSEKSGKTNLKAGKHAVTVDYFEASGGEELRVEIEGQNFNRRSLNDIIAPPPPKTVAENEAEKPWEVNAELAAKGKEIFLSAGCASCHQLQQGEMKLASSLKARPLADIKNEGGCLSEQPAAKIPHFALNAAQQKGIVAALTALKKPMTELSEGDRVHRNLVRFNCYGCHSRNEIGGVQDNVNEWFTSTMKEIGDEGRLPPHLTIVGAKLTEATLKKVIENGEKVRPYMHTHMPKFGAQNVGALVEQLTAADVGKVPEVPSVQVDDADKRFKASGRFIVGAQALGCIKCHTFTDRGTPGIQVMDLATMGERLRPEWYYHYMLNPPAFRPGTRMPAGWPNGQTVLPKVLEGDTAKQIRATWAYLLDGPKAQVPVGMVQAQIELLPIDEPLIYRNFIEGAGPRAIAVGFPQKVNYAWDANHNRMALLWQGAFIDASMHWIGRGPGYQKPLGEPVAQLPADAPLAILESNTSEWPATTNRDNKDPNYKFLGYYLNDLRAPTFRFKFHGATVEDYSIPKVEGEIVTLVRTLSFASEELQPNLHFLAAAGAKIETEEGWYVVNDTLRIKITSAEKPLIRESKGRKELLIPVKLEEGKGKLGLEYEW